jgi:curved DNA-binding protein CbpA
MEQKDYYKVLEVTETSSADEIKKSYRNLAFQYHPDRNAGKEEMMKAINEAYAVLSNPVKREEYDSLRQRYGPSATDHFRQYHTDQDIFRGSDINQIFEELSKAFGLSSTQDVFSRSGFYGQSYRTFEFKAPGGTGKGFFFSGPLGGAWQEGLKMPPYQARQAAGIKQRIASRVAQKILTAFQKSMAKRLGIVLPEHGRDLHDVLRITTKQATAGGKVEYRYAKQGDPRDLLVTVPQGIKESQQIKLKGLGEAGKNGGETGSLYLKVRIHRPFTEIIRAAVKKLKNAVGL